MMLSEEDSGWVSGDEEIEIEDLDDSDSDPVEAVA